MNKDNIQTPTADQIIQRFGQGVTDMFEQMTRGNWIDDHGHNVKLNATMISLMPIVQAAIDYRATPQPVIAPTQTPLTEQQVQDIYVSAGSPWAVHIAFVRAVEAAHGIGVKT